MSNSKSAASALFGTVAALANSVTKAIGTVDTGVGMVTTSVEVAARRQKARSKLDEVSYKREIVTNKAMDLELQKEQVNDWISQKEDRGPRYQATYDDLMKVLDPEYQPVSAAA